MSLKRGFLTFGSWTLASRVAGFVRDVLMAAVLGASPLADAFVVAQRLPNMFRNLFAEGAFSAAFVPLFIEARRDEGDDAARKFAAETNAALFLGLLLFCGVMIIGMPWVIRVIAPGFSDDPFRYATAVTLAQISFPYLLLISLTSLQGGVLNAVGRLAPFAAAPVLYNVIQIITISALPWLSERWGFDNGRTLAWSITTAGVGQFLLLAYFCRRAGFPAGLSWPRGTPRARLFLRRLGPGVIGAGATQINLVMSTLLASLLPVGTVAHLYYADRLNLLPAGVIGMAVVTAALPLLAAAVQAKDEQRISETFSRAIDLSMAFGMPAAVGIAALAYPIFEVLFVRGAFTSADAAGAAYAMTGYALGIPAYILLRVCATRFHAAGDTTTPVRASFVAMATNLACAVWLMQYLDALGITLALSIASWTNFVVLRWRLKEQKAFTLDAASQRRLPRIVFASAVMGGVCWGLAHWLGPVIATSHTLVGIALLTAMVGAGAAVYAGLILATGALRASDLKAMLKKAPKDPSLKIAPHAPE